MGRISTKENKTPYQLFREEMGLSREAASEKLKWISAERIEKIENEKSLPHPDEVLEMSVVYKKPRLCNHYCANVCPIGQEYVPEVKVKDLSQIVLEMLASLNSIQKRKNRLIEITADGEISDDEIADFVHIQEELERISITVETLQLWSERMCPFCDRVYDESEYCHCPYCSGELEVEKGERYFKACPDCDGTMYWDGTWMCSNCDCEIETGEDDYDGIIEG